MDSSISIKVHTAVQVTPHEIPVTINTTVEDVIIETSKLLNIGPVARHLFGLRVLSITDDNLWLSPSLFILYAKSEQHVYEYKLRYKMPDVKRLKSTDRHAYNFYFYQVKSDLLKSKVTGLCYDTYKRELIGLGVADMYRAILEEDKSRETVEQNYKQFMPKEVVKQHMFFLKKPVQDTLKKIINNNTVDTHYVSVIKESYLEQFNSIAPDYLEEEYKALHNENGSSVNVTFRVNPFHTEMPGVRMCTENRKEWVHLAAIDDLCFLSTTDDGNVEISRKTGIPIHIKFLNTSIMYSFITLLNGYYRLMVNWNFDLCASTNTPTLSKLKSIRAHGPISIMKSTSILKKKMSKKPGSFILRQSMKNYENYVIDVCVNQSMKPMTYVIEGKDGFYKLAGDNNIEYPSIWRLITNNKMSLNFLECIFPSDIAMNELLLCQNTNIKHISNDDDEDKINGPHLINSDSIKLLKTICSPKKKLQSLMKVRVATWCKSKRNESTVVVKLFQDDVNISLHLMDLLSLSKRWSSVSSSAIVRLFGLCVDTPTALVSEYFPLGPLDAYLRIGNNFKYFNHFQDDGRSYQNENPILTTNTSFNQFMEQLTSKEEIQNNMLSAINCQKKTYQFNNATLSLQQVIGQGFYGVVLEGLLEYNDKNNKKVAVKHMKRSFQTEDFQREIGIIEGLNHPNIVKIEGVLEEPNLMLVMEYVELGSLSSYLRLHEDELIEETNRLLKYSLDIAQGMEYLGSLNIIHRDLATRNILVASPTTVKISDFGLAQFLPDEKYYYLQTMRDLPLKWHAPEAILYGKFSPKTDIWAYGVLLFEIFSLGKEPNVVSKLEERLDVENLIRVLEEGHRLQCPSCPPCTMEIYNKLMSPCWAYIASDRPNFTHLINNIQSIMAVGIDENSIQG